MTIMQLENRDLSDLEYLAEVGFEQVPCSDPEVLEMQARVKARISGLRSGYHFVFISLITGCFVGMSVFFGFYYSPEIEMNIPLAKNEEIPAPDTVSYASLNLDTVHVLEENFINKPALTIKAYKAAIVASEETVEQMPAKSMAITSEESVHRDKLLYIPNASCVYLNDMKISDYTILYFNRSYKPSTGGNVPVLYATKGDLLKDINLLEPQKNYYLHQAISDAMHMFKNKRYSACLKALNGISGFNENDINCHFYSGMCRYYLEDYEGAIRDFDACISHSNNSFLPESEFYKAQCLLESGNAGKASKLFRKIADEGGFYAEKAAAVCLQ